MTNGDMLIVCVSFKSAGAKKWPAVKIAESSPQIHPKSKASLLKRINPRPQDLRPFSD